MRKTRQLFCLLLCAMAALVMTSKGVLTIAGAITLSPLTSFEFNNPIGIDFHEPNGGNLIMSVNWFSGSPNNLDLVNVTTKEASTFSSLANLTDELKIATQRTTACAQFPVGDVFTGNGHPGEIVRLDAAGVVYGPDDFNAPGDHLNPGNPHPGVPANFSWVKLPNSLPDDLLRGSLYVDRCAGFNGDLIVVTSIDTAFPVNGGGAVWRISKTGIATMLNGGNRILRNVGDHCEIGQTCGVHLEGVITVPTSFGPPWGGTIIAGDENDNVDLTRDGRVWSIPASGAATAFNLAFNVGDVHHPVKTEDLDIIDGDNFFGVNFGNARVLVAAASDFAGSVGDILLTQEFPCGSQHSALVQPCIGGGERTSGLYAIHSDGVSLTITPFTFSETSVTNVDTWEHVTFAPLLTPDTREPPSVAIVKLTNGTNNDTGTGPMVPVGSTVTWTYIVRNTGGVTLTNVRVTDDIVGPICTIGTLAAGATESCTKTGIAVAGQYTNTGTVVGTPPTGAVVVDRNPDHYFGAEPSITIVKKTNGTDNDTPPGPTVPVGSTVTWTYLVTNTGNVPLTNVLVTDNRIGAITCPAATLAVGASMTCTATGMAVAGQYANIGSVTGTPPVGPNVTASNPDHYFAAQQPPNVKIKKVGNGPIKIGDFAKFTIKVTNLGPGSATGVKVTDRLPDHLTWLDNRDACTIDDGVMVCNIGTMTQGQVFTVVLKAKLTKASFGRSICVPPHHHGDNCDHEQRRNGHRRGDGCEHERDVQGHFDGDGCDHDNHRSNHHDGDGCDHDRHKRPDCRIKNTAKVTASNEDPTRLGDNSSTASIKIERSRHHHGDHCDHERRRNGHHDGDRCAHEEDMHRH